MALSALARSHEIPDLKFHATAADAIIQPFMAVARKVRRVDREIR